MMREPIVAEREKKLWHLVWSGRMWIKYLNKWYEVNPDAYEILDKDHFRVTIRPEKDEELIDVIVNDFELEDPMLGRENKDDK